jgi:hypothetical protein
MTGKERGKEKDKGDGRKEALIRAELSDYLHR